MGFDYDKEMARIDELFARMSDDEFIKLMRDSGFLHCSRMVFEEKEETPIARRRGMSTCP